MLKVFNMMQLITEEKLKIFNVWSDSLDDPRVLVIRTDREKCKVNSGYYIAIRECCLKSDRMMHMSGIELL